MGTRPVTPRHALLFVFVVATLVLMVVGALGSITLLKTSLYHAAEQEAGREARVVSDTGLAAALSHGALNRRDLSVAASQYAAVRRDLPLTGVVIWLATGRAVFVGGSGQLDSTHSMPRLVAVARSSGATRIASGTEPGDRAMLEVAVPLGRRARNAVAEFLFTRSGIEATVRAAEQHLYAFTGVGALVMYLAILPLLARLVKRMPLPVDPFRHAALAELKLALARRELILHYQPKAQIETGRIVGAEALVRWNHPQRGLLGPGEFLPLAESSPDLLEELTYQVLERAISQCAGWVRDGYEIQVAVNVAPSVLLGGSLVALVKETLLRYDVDASMLVVELTESALMQGDEDVTGHLRELRDLGVSVSIDDFGTGNSSLSRLRSLPLDELKVDRSFISGISTDARDLGITRHIVHLGLELGLRVVAEGVEDERTLWLLRTLGCEVAQGFHLARPMPEEQLRVWLSERETHRPQGTSSCDPTPRIA